MSDKSIIVSISGAQSTGKSTLLDNVKNGLGYYVDDFKVARHVLAEFEQPLYEILRDVDSTISFQEQILLAKIEHDRNLSNDEHEFIFVERCPADIYAFAFTWRTYFNNEKYDDWLNTYYIKCLQGMYHYDISILIQPGLFDHIDDGVRAKADTQKDVDHVLNFMLTRHWMNANFVKPKFHLHRIGISDIILRLDSVEQALTDGKKYFNYYSELMSNL